MQLEEVYKLTLITEFGQFNAIVFTFVLCVSLLISKAVVMLAKFSSVEHEKGVNKCMSFLSGHSEMDIKKIQNSNELQVSGHNLLWGFKKALKFYYTPVKQEHTGNILDYNIWITIILAILLMIIVLFGGT